MDGKCTVDAVQETQYNPDSINQASKTYPDDVISHTNVRI